MYKLTLAERDVYLTNVYDEIRKRKKMLFDKFRTIKENEEKNEFLNLVKRDYQNYYDFILEEKEKQAEAMGALSAYVNNIIVDGGLTDEDLEMSRRDHEKIVQEIGTIRHGIDTLMEERKSEYVTPGTTIPSDVSEWAIG